MVNIHQYRQAEIDRKTEIEGQRQKEREIHGLTYNSTGRQKEIERQRKREREIYEREKGLHEGRQTKLEFEYCEGKAHTKRTGRVFVWMAVGGCECGCVRERQPGNNFAILEARQWLYCILLPSSDVHCQN